MMYFEEAVPGVYYIERGDLIVLVHPPYLYGLTKKGKEYGYYLPFSLPALLEEVKAVRLGDL